jgi:hypothetical protein
MAIALVLPAAAHAQVQPRDLGADAVEFDERDRVIDDRDMKLPAAPQAQNLVEFDPRRPTSLKFFIDAASLTVNEKGVIRFTVVVKGEGSTQNVTYEGMQCSEGIRKVYAYGARDGAWRPATGSNWQPIGPQQTEPYRHGLAKYYFCPARHSIRTPAEGIEALRRGEHKFVNDLNDNAPKPR